MKTTMTTQAEVRAALIAERTALEAQWDMREGNQDWTYFDLPSEVVDAFCDLDDRISESLALRGTP